MEKDIADLEVRLGARTYGVIVANLRALANDERTRTANAQVLATMFGVNAELANALCDRHCIPAGTML